MIFLDLTFANQRMSNGHTFISQRYILDLIMDILSYGDGSVTSFSTKEHFKFYNDLFFFNYVCCINYVLMLY